MHRVLVESPLCLCKHSFGRFSSHWLQDRKVCNKDIGMVGIGTANSFWQVANGHIQGICCYMTKKVKVCLINTKENQNEGSTIWKFPLKIRLLRLTQVCTRMHEVLEGMRKIYLSVPPPIWPVHFWINTHALGICMPLCSINHFFFKHWVPKKIPDKLNRISIPDSVLLIPRLLVVPDLNCRFGKLLKEGKLNHTLDIQEAIQNNKNKWNVPAHNWHYQVDSTSS